MSSVSPSDSDGVLLGKGLHFWRPLDVLDLERSFERCLMSAMDWDRLKPWSGESLDEMLELGETGLQAKGLGAGENIAAEPRLFEEDPVRGGEKADSPFDASECKGDSILW